MYTFPLGGKVFVIVWVMIRAVLSPLIKETEVIVDAIKMFTSKSKLKKLYYKLTL